MSEASGIFRRFAYSLLQYAQTPTLNPPSSPSPPMLYGRALHAATHAALAQLLGGGGDDSSSSGGLNDEAAVLAAFERVGGWVGGWMGALVGEFVCV